VTKENNKNNHNNNKPEIKICENKKGTCELIDVISLDRNVIKKEGEKILKYKDLITRNLVHVECESNSVTGNNRGDCTISESFRQYLSNIPRKHEIKELQKQPHWVPHTYFRK
jgi:hypothetical protein